MASGGGVEALDLLVADGEATFGTDVAEALEATGESVTAVAIPSAEEAIARGTRDDVDAIIVGDTVGPAAITRLTNETDCPVVLLTDATTEDPIRDAVEAGVTDVFPRVTAASQYELLVERITGGGPTDGVSGDPSADGDDETIETGQAYRTVFESVSDGLVIHDPATGEIIDANERACELYGRSREEVLGATVDQVTGPNEEYTLDRANELIQRARREGPQLFEWQGQRGPDDEPFPMEVHLDVVEIRGDERVLASLRDITERKRREEMIRALHESTDALHEADTPREVCEATVTAAREVLDLSMPACWLRGVEEPDLLSPVAATEEAREAALGGDSPGEFEPGDFQYEAYESGSMRVYDPGDLYEETPLGRAILIPLGEHGMFGAAEPGIDAFDDVTLDAARILARHATTALDRVERERELRESERRLRLIAERVEEIIYLANADLTEVQYVNPAYADIFGRPVEELYEDARAFLEAVHPGDRDSYEADVEAMLADIEAGDPDDRYDFSFRIQRPDGQIRWLESTGYPIRSETDDPHQFVGVTKDVTEQHRREETLETFHEATRELTEADSREAVCRQAVAAAEDVLGFPLVSAFLYEDTTGRLEPTAATTRLRNLDVDLPAVGPGESLPWQVYVEGDAATGSEAGTNVYGPGVSGPDVVLPLGSHGVMLVGASTEEFDAEDVELAQILAATVEAALNHVADEQTLAAREEELRRQEERATRLERLNTIIRDIEQATVEQSSRAGIEEAVCERLIDVEIHDLVWIAEPAVGDDELVPRTSTGKNESYVTFSALKGGACQWTPGQASEEAGLYRPFPVTVPDFRAR